MKRIIAALLLLLVGARTEAQMGEFEVNGYLLKNVLAGADPIALVIDRSDSFGVALAARVSIGIVQTWPLPGGVSTFFSPANSTSGMGLPLFQGTATSGHPYGSSSQGKHEISGTSLNYHAASGTPDAGDEWFGRGVAQEWYMSSAYTPIGASNNRVVAFRQTFQNVCELGVNGRPFTTGNTVKAYPVIYEYTTPSDRVPDFQLTDNGYTGTPVTFDPDTDCVEMFHRGGSHGAAAAVPGTVNRLRSGLTLGTNLASGNIDIGVLRTSGIDKYMNFNGFLIDNESKAGSAFLPMADVSWAEYGHAVSAASTLADPKRYTDTQQTDSYDVLAINRVRRPVIVSLLADEDNTYEQIVDRAQAWVTRTRASYAAIGTPSPIMVLTTMPVHQVGALTASQSSDVSALTSLAYRAVALANPADVVFLDAAAWTEFNRFWASGNRTAGAEAWLDAHGYNAFVSTSGTKDFTTNGGCSSGAAMDLLDGSDLHPAGAPEAEAFAHMLLQIILQSQAPVSVIAPQGLRSTRIARLSRVFRN